MTNITFNKIKTAILNSNHDLQPIERIQVQDGTFNVHKDYKVGKKTFYKVSFPKATSNQIQRMRRELRM